MDEPSLMPMKFIQLERSTFVKRLAKFCNQNFVGVEALAQPASKSAVRRDGLFPAGEMRECHAGAHAALAAGRAFLTVFYGLSEAVFALAMTWNRFYYAVAPQVG